jgi:Family of unknown function (DUF6157)
MDRLSSFLSPYLVGQVPAMNAAIYCWYAVCSRKITELVPGHLRPPIIMKSTNYYNTLVQSADDSPATKGEAPPVKPDKEKTVAVLQYEMIKDNPYRYTSDDVIFGVYAKRNNIGNDIYKEERKKFFSKGQACFRSSPLTKRYGWGVHSDEKGRIALYGMDTPEYKKFATDPNTEKVKSMKRGRNAD